MKRGEFDDKTRTGSVKAAVNLYGRRSFEYNSPLKKPQMDSSEQSPRKSELHLARREIKPFKENRRIVESVKTRAEFELINTKKTLRDLSLRIEESNSRAKTHTQDMYSVLEVNYEYAEIMKELECIKHELGKLKLDMDSVLEKKRGTEEEIKALSLKIWSHSKTMEAVTKEIEELNGEHMLVELARIEALKECGTIEAQRKAAKKKHSSTMEETRKKVNQINDLRSDLALVEELEAAKKLLSSIKEEGFQFMASLDSIRNELKHVTEKTAPLKKTQAKTDLTVQNLNSKLLRAKAKLESVSSAEERTKSIVLNLSLTIEQLKTEAGAAKEETEHNIGKTAKIKSEFPKMERGKDLAEGRLQAALRELEEVKSSEAIALENLRRVTENIMRARASVSQHSSSITISAFEYKYLTGREIGAKEIADKKVAAAQAWVEALKASEKEILMKTEMAHRQNKEIRTDRPVSARRSVGQKSEHEHLQVEAAPVNRNSIRTPARQAKFRKAASPETRHVPRSPSFKVKKRMEVMPNLAKFFGRKNIERGV